ncbi:hypothetical protein SUGI_0443800 [Cryptomeria japonica]|nr:hypothetical protein SUGI_0443800 [Cryptomeria japonica]
MDSGIDPRCWEGLLEATLRIVSEKDNTMLMEPFSKEEVHSVVFGLHLDKAPGSDGFLTSFYKKCWFMGANMWKLVEDVRRKGKFVKEINNSIMVMIPKKSKCQSLDDYSPIVLISAKQNGFTLGREIVDNIILRSEYLHSMSTERKKGVAIKLDISKAYEMVC